MSDYAIIGKKGAGKSLITVTKIRRYLKVGFPVATNMDLFLDVLMPPLSRATAVRLPDFPTASQLWALGQGGDSNDEDYFGLIALDELAVFLNSRQWRDDKRGEVIEYLRHTRKMRWHTFMLSQGLKSMDSQLRDELLDHHVILKRLDKIPVPYIGGLLKISGFSGRFIKLHVAFVRYGMAHNSPIVDRWFFLGHKRIYQSYDTQQVFTKDNKFIERDYPRFTATPCGYFTYHTEPQKIEVMGTYTMLSAWHLKGRYMPWHQLYRNHALALSAMVCLLYGVFTFYSYVSNYFNPLQPPKKIEVLTPSDLPEIKISHDITGYIDNGYYYVLTLKDGHIKYATKTQIIDNKKLFLINGQWHGLKHEVKLK